MEGKLDELGGDIIIMKDKQESEERKAKEVQKEQANQLARRPSILGRLRSGSVTAVSGEDAAAEALRAVTEQLTIVKTKKNPLVRLKNLLGYCVAVQGPAEVRAFSAQMSNLALTCVLLLYAAAVCLLVRQRDFPVGGLGAERLHPPHHRVYVLERAQENVEEVQLGPGRAGVADVDGRLGLEGRDRGGWQALLILQARPQEPGLFEVRPEADARRVQGKFWLGHSDGGRVYVLPRVHVQGRVRGGEDGEGGEGQADQQDFRVAEEECDEEVLHLRQGECSRSHEKDVARGRGQLGVRQLTSAPIGTPTNTVLLCFKDLDSRVFVSLDSPDEFSLFSVFLEPKWSCWDAQR